MKYPLLEPVVNEIGGGVATLARNADMDAAELAEKLAGEKELSLDDAIRLSDALNSFFNVNKIFTPFLFRTNIVMEESEEEKQKIKLNERRGSIELTPELVIHCLKGIRKHVLYSEGLAQSYEDWKKNRSEAEVRIFVDMDYDVLTYAIETVERIWYHQR